VQGRRTLAANLGSGLVSVAAKWALKSEHGLRLKKQRGCMDRVRQMSAFSSRVSGAISLRRNPGNVQVTALCTRTAVSRALCASASVLVDTAPWSGHVRIDLGQRRANRADVR